MRRNPLKSSRSSVNVNKTTNKYDDAEALSTMARSVSMQTAGHKQRLIAEEILRHGNARVAGETVAVKQLDKNGVQGNTEFLAEVLRLSLVHHPNLVNLIGYCADGHQRILVYEYMCNGSLGHLLGRRALDNTKPIEEQNLVAWAKPLFKDKTKFTLMVDPLLEGRYPLKGLYQAVAVTAMCLQEEASTRPLIADVVTALEYLADENANDENIDDEITIAVEA
ncbi:unnamed protein product [Fraxinus pennsylvanica]|uniref:Protein kinase domain-containing protein n=1 Tax=Fraxinus pennsylvanica TaxID=56036 RepID=A0AAD1YSR5_9LAMI|nr:unnamed protein product [Fraxinus pennsylvanica]